MFVSTVTRSWPCPRANLTISKHRKRIQARGSTFITGRLWRITSAAFQCLLSGIHEGIALCTTVNGVKPNCTNVLLQLPANICGIVKVSTWRHPYNVIHSRASCKSLCRDLRHRYHTILKCMMKLGTVDVKGCFYLSSFKHVYQM